MKPSETLKQIAIALAFLSACAPVANAGLIALLRGDDASASPCQHLAFVGSAKVEAVQGKPLRLQGIDGWAQLHTGATLEPGDLIRSEDGIVLLRMRVTDSFIKVTPHTLVRLVPLEKNESTLANVNKGFVVRACRGIAESRDSSGIWKPIEINAVLPDGAALRTGTGATVDLFNTASNRPLRITGKADLALNSAIAARIISQTALASVR